MTGGRTVGLRRVGAQLVTSIPMEVNHALVKLGQKKYNIVCSQCHGVMGDGNSVVAENMGLRLPPSQPPPPPSPASS